MFKTGCMMGKRATGYGVRRTPIGLLSPTESVGLCPQVMSGREAPARFAKREL